MRLREGEQARYVPLDAGPALMKGIDENSRYEEIGHSGRRIVDRNEPLRGMDSSKPLLPTTYITIPLTVHFENNSQVDNLKALTAATLQSSASMTSSHNLSTHRSMPLGVVAESAQICRLYKEGVPSSRSINST